MKTICVKVKLTPEQETEFDQAITELEWAWNYCLKIYLYNHCRKWYEWAANTKAKVDKAMADIEKLPAKQKEFVKQYFWGDPASRPAKLDASQRKLVDNEKGVLKILHLWSQFDIEGIIETPLRISEPSAYTGASCVIAEGGPFWATEIVEKNNDAGEPQKVRKSKLIDGKKPYTPLRITEHKYPLVPSGQFKDREIIDWTDLIVKAVLNSVRESEGLPELNLHSNYINGLISQNGSLTKAWAAFLDVNRKQSKRPKFKNEQYKLNTLLNLYAPNIADKESGENWIEAKQLGQLEVTDRTWRARLGEDSLRSHCVTNKRSGYYVHITTEHPLQADKTVLAKQLTKVKKENGIDSVEYKELALKIADLDSKIKSSKTISRKKELVVGIDPGVNAIVATDHGALYTPNLSRERITTHLEKLQSRLKHAQQINDDLWKQGNSTKLENLKPEDQANFVIQDKRPKTKNELKLEHKIARLHERGASSSRHFNHKLSTRIARTYTHISWEETKLANLLKQAKAKPDMSGIGYLPNGAAAKRSLNWLLKQRCLGDLRERTKKKVDEYGGVWHDSAPKYTSQKCHCCGYQDPEQRDESNFTCKNESCKMYGVPQNADVNAARNHKKAIFELGEVKYNLLSLQYDISARKRHRKRHKQKPKVTVIKLPNNTFSTSNNI
ncbi:transposase [Cylindrospermopsis phage Cr-LKS4]|jgi:transposase|nr:transposase [Cylindrospermopsis phage Cr-LKS4]